MWQATKMTLAVAFLVFFIVAVVVGGEPRLKDGFYAPTEALCRTGPTVIDRSLIRPWVGRAANVQKVAYSRKYPGRLIIDNSEVCFLVRRHKHIDYLRCSHGGGVDEAWRYTYFDRNGAIYLDGRAF